MSSRGAYWLPRFSLYFCQQCLKRLSETWGTEFTSNHARMQTSLRLHTSERRQKPQIYLYENCYNVSIRVKGRIYRAIMMSTLLYGAETWTVYKRHVKRLHAFMMRHMWSIMKIRWQDKVTNIKVVKRAGLTSMEDLLIRKNLRCTGHLLRMPTDRLPRQILYSQLPDGQRPRGRLRLRYKDTIKRNLKKRDIDTNSWKSLALQRDVWRDTVK